MKNNANKREAPFKQQSNDHFKCINGVEFAGVHIILDLWGASYLNDVERMENTLKLCIQHCHATLLHIHLHTFTPSGGLSGVAVLAESHISVHTWPERSYAAFDIFMCGSAEPEKAIDILITTFQASSHNVKTIKRGCLPV